jgi:hypothetical protein
MLIAINVPVAVAAGANALCPPIPWRSQVRVREYAVSGSAVSSVLITVLR